ncbi:RNA-binding S4 domain-containing protein [Metamycoplasma neophronis]|uniref:RNA-binding S4 domain-containing protein n=1 Tax=Metamycoplasma neophronis TaxID=872983 RepID=A0ABY2Z169_9BACT|nr:RNA-binding S4 domain-containing protein [Metamycoplasma neophronis]TPR54288.1 RNA-binding S4 domain-containing protein [Metamycoplasma neophronis]
MKVEITGEFIKLSQFLKKIEACPTGGMAKYFVKIHKILVNDKPVDGRNAKLRVGDTIWIDDNIYILVAKKEQ